MTATHLGAQDSTLGMARGAAASRRRSSARVDAVAIYAAAALLACLGLVRVADFYHDDAFISLRYATRLLAGEGLTWNPDERVEGFTHPLWLGQVALLGAVGMDLTAAARWLGSAYLAAIFVLWWRAGAAPLLLLVLMTGPGVLLWTRSGLETIGFGFWLAGGAWSAQEALWAERGERAWRWAGVAGAALGAAALMRPEGAGAGLVAVALLAAHRRWRPSAAALLAFGVVAGGYELFRIAYFGELFPNTAYAKLGGLPAQSRVWGGLVYLWDTQEIWLPSAVITAAAFCLSRGRRPFAMLMIPAPILACVLLAGGDHMPAGRLVVPLLVSMLLAAAVAGRAGWRHRALVNAGAGVVAAAQFAALLATPVECDAAAVTGEYVGRFLERELPAGTTVATATAGSTPYFAPSIRFIDTLGLNDRHIARRQIFQLTTAWQHVPGHLKGDGPYVLTRAPDVIVLGPAQGLIGDDPTGWFLTDFELLRAPEFHARYRPFRFVVPVDPAAIARRPLPGRVDRHPHIVVVLYVRGDSPAVAKLLSLGTPIAAPRPA